MIRARLIATTAMVAVLAVAGGAAALPKTPVISGTNGPGPGASFSFSTTSLSVTQTNSRVVIDWASFNIAAGETVTFAQPSSTAIALNRVAAGSMTTIAGALNANGGVWIFSPAGMIIGNGAAVNVGSFLASTAIADSTTMSDFLCGCGSIPFQPQPASATPSITVQAGAAINANAGFVELNSPTIVQGGNITASDSVDYSALPGGEIDFDTEPNGFKLTDFFGTTAPAQNQATSITHTGVTTAGQVVTFETFNDPSLGAPVSSVINLSGHVTANGILSDNTTGTAYGVLLVADDTVNGINSGNFQISAGSPTQINATGSVITSDARIGAVAGTITTGDWTAGDLGGSGLMILAGSGGLNVAGTLNLSGAGEATLSALGPVNITGAINSGEADGLSITGSSIAVSSDIALSHGFFSLATPGALTVTGGISFGPEGGSLIESGSSPVVLNGSFGAGGDLGQNVSLTFTGTPDSGQSLSIGGQAYTLIFNQSELLGANSNLGGHYALATPLDLTGTIFGGAPIASLVNTPFTGTFTGLGNTISNLAISDVTPIPLVGPLGYAGNGVVGLFGAVGHGGVIEDVALSNASVSGGDGETVGALVGELNGTVLNSFSSGTVTTGSHINLTVGIAYAGAGGLVGSSNGAIIGSRSSASVTGGDAFVGGLVGSSFGGGSIADSVATGDVHVGDNPAGNPSVPIGGGLVGLVDGYQFGGVNPLPTPVSGSSATGAVFGGAGSFLGGFVGGVIQGQVTTSYATGSVTQSAGGQNGQDSIAGGFAGYVGPGGSVTQSWSEAPVSTVGSSGAPVVGGVGGYETLAGGFVGDMDQGAVVSEAYALGSVTSAGTANAVLGGFAGTILRSSSADHVYATGLVSGPGALGGLVGVLGDTLFSDTSGTISDGYWDQGTTGQTIGANTIGTGAATNLTGIGGSTGLSPYAPTTYANFDLANTWFMLPGGTRPLLRSEYSTTITDAHQLQLMAMNPAANYVLANDIDMSETTQASGVWNPASGFVPVGPSETSAFTGTLDGAGHTISNLTIVDATAVNQTTFGGYASNGFAGMFGFLGPASLVENLQIDNASVTSGDGAEAGILAGALEGTAFNVSTSGSVTVGNDVTTALGLAYANAGGLAGIFDGLAINTSSSASVTGGDALIGGLIGSAANGGMPSGIIYASHASGSVSVGGSSSTGQLAEGGGLVGNLYGFAFGVVNPNPLSVAASYATGNVTGGGGSLIGGLVGVVEEGSVTASYATGAVTQTAGGQNGQSSIAGGLAGAILDNSIVDKSYASGAVTTVGGPIASLFTVAGGFTGDIDGSSVEKDYSLGSVTATGSGFSALGGFAGTIVVGGQADQVYATGLVSGPAGSVLGGLAGSLNNPSTLSNSYWDEGTTGQTVAVGANNGTISNVTGVGGATGLSPYDPASYPAFTFGATPGDNDSWVILPGETRPMLVAEYSTNISNAHQLELMSLDLTGAYTLAGNIDVSEVTNPAGVWNPANGFVPVGGNSEAAFTGTFNGAGYTISNLTIIQTTPLAQVSGLTTFGMLGLFGYASGALIENVTLAKAQITGGDGMRAGAVVGRLDGGSLVDVASNGTITVGSSALFAGACCAIASDGGLVGATSGSILDSHSSATVTANSGYAGGIVGSFFGISITDSYATGAVSTGNFNGIALSAGALAGGVAGLISGGTVTGSYATGPVTGGAGSAIGGFAANIQNAATVTDSYATGSVTQTAGGQNGQNDLIGGFAGANSGATIMQSFASGAVTTVSGPAAGGLTTEAGGFVGDNEGVIADAYATGAVSSSGGGSAVLGGFAGFVDSGGSLNQVYATGLVSGAGTLEGLVGQVGNSTLTDTSGQITNSYWDEGTTGQTSGFTLSGAGSATNVVGMGGRTGINPFAQATYAGWDFNNTWSTPSAGFYPELFGASHVLSVTGGVTTFIYGGYTAVTYAELGLQGGDTASVVQGLIASISGTTTSSSGFDNVGSYTVTFGSAVATGSSGAYRILYAPGTVTVTPRALTASLTGSVEKTYDGTTAATLTAGNYQLGGLVAGDSVSLNDPTSGTYASKDAGSGIGVNVSGLAVSGADAGDYTVNGTASAAVGIIDPKALTISLVGTVEKIYDGTTTATLTAGNYQLGGVIAGDSVSLNDPTNGTYASKDVGTGIVVSVSGLALSGAAAGDYTIGSASGAIGVIDPKALTAALTGTVEKTYDGTTSATLTAGNYLLSGVISGDSVSLNDPAIGSYANTGPGAGIVVTANGLALTGADAADYTVNPSASAPIGSIDSSVASVIQVQIVTTSSEIDLTQLTSPGDGGAIIAPPSGDQTIAEQTTGDGDLTTPGASPLDDTAAAGYSLGASFPDDQSAGADTTGAPSEDQTAGGGAQQSSGGDAQGQGGAGQGGAGQGPGAGGGPAGADQALNAPPLVAGASDAAATDETTPAAGQGAQGGVFPVARSAANHGRGAGDNTGVTGAGNGDLWKGANLSGGTSP